MARKLRAAWIERILKLGLVHHPEAFWLLVVSYRERESRMEILRVLQDIRHMAKDLGMYREALPTLRFATRQNTRRAEDSAWGV